MEETIKTFLPFKASEQFSAIYKKGMVYVHGEITKEDLSNFVETHLIDIIEILDSVKEKNKLEEYRLSLAWHSPEEEPGLNKFFVYEDTDGSCEADCFFSDRIRWKDYVVRYGLSRWVYVDDLIPGNLIKK